jgi:hypothetical protein
MYLILAWVVPDQGFESRQGLGIFLFTTASRPALWPTQPIIQWVRRGSFPGGKAEGRETAHSPPSNAKVKNAWSYTSIPQYACMAWSSDKKHSDNFTLPYQVTEHLLSTSIHLSFKSV